MSQRQDDNDRPPPPVLDYRGPEGAPPFSITQCLTSAAMTAFGLLAALLWPRFNRGFTEAQALFAAVGFLALLSFVLWARDVWKCVERRGSGLGVLLGVILLVLIGALRAVFK